MKILIIGSKGFIGSHCVSHFEKQHDVWQCDVVVDYVNKKYFLLDTTNASYDEVFENQNFDFCINCSGAASVPDSMKNPQRDFSLNVANVFKQLDAIRKHNPKCKYINLSSAAVYGNPNYLPIDEEHPLAPISPYGDHKKMAEEICQEFYDKYDIGSCSLRVFSAYGPGLQKQLFWDLYTKALNRIEVQLYGTGNESRDFIFISDLVVAIDLVMQKSEFKHDIINIANGTEIKIGDAVRDFYQILNPKVKVIFGGEERPGDPINWVANIEKLKKMGYSNSVSMLEGLENYIQWVKEVG